MNLFNDLLTEVDAFAPTYLVKKVSPGEWKVVKFGSRKEPESQTQVQLRHKGYWTDSPGFIHKGQAEKHIKLVKQFLQDGEPQMAAYQIDDKGKVTSKKFG